MPVLNDADRIFNGGAAASRVYAGTHKVWPKDFVASAWGTVAVEYDFGRTDLVTLAADQVHVNSVAPASGQVTTPVTNAGNAAWSPRYDRTSPSGRKCLNYPVANGQERLYSLVTPVAQPPPITIVMVIALDTLTMDVEPCGDYAGLYLTRQNSIDQWVVMNNQYVYTAVPPDTAWHVVVGVNNGAQSQFWMDGVLRHTGNDGNGQMIRVVIGNYGNGGYSPDCGIGHAIWYRGVVANIPGMSHALKRVWGTV